jgi:Fic family protein
MVIHYQAPQSYLLYDKFRVVDALLEAKASVIALTTLPYQKTWAQNLQEMELKREVAGTSRIEGADFTEREFAVAIDDSASEVGMTRSQRQARAAINAYRWIGKLDPAAPVTIDLVKQIHRRMVSGCDDDHCEPGQFRRSGENVIFGTPRHRGAEGGKECESAIELLIGAVQSEFRAHDPLIQALAFHYHFGAIHPFQDGNGRTARAMEALMLRRAKLNDSLFISMSNYYYEEKDEYLAALTKARSLEFDLTEFLEFGLKGVATNCKRMLAEVNRHVAKSLFREVMAQMYGRLKSTRKRALAERQMAILDRLLDLDDPIDYLELFSILEARYNKLKSPMITYVRDLNHLSGLGAIRVSKTKSNQFLVKIHLTWGTDVTATSFYEELANMPRAKTRLRVSDGS